MKLVYIKWLDSYGCSSTWTPLHTEKVEPLYCQSVGWLMYDGDDCKTIVPHISQESHTETEQQGCGDMTIPAAAIIELIPLRLPGAEDKLL